MGTIIRIPLISQVAGKIAVEPSTDSNRGCNTSEELIKRKLQNVSAKKPVSHEHQSQPKSWPANLSTKVFTELTTDCADDVETLNFESTRNAAVRFISKIRASSSAIMSLREDAVVECNNVVCSNHELLRHGYQQMRVKTRIQRKSVVGSSTSHKTQLFSLMFLRFPGQSAANAFRENQWSESYSGCDHLRTS